MNSRDIFQTLAEATAELWLSFDSPEWLSEREAMRRYSKGTIDAWVQSGLIVAVQRDNGRRVYDNHRLRALHAFHQNGKNLHEMARLLDACGDDLTLVKSVMRRH